MKITLLILISLSCWYYWTVYWINNKDYNFIVSNKDMNEQIAKNDYNNFMLDKYIFMHKLYK